MSRPRLLFLVTEDWYFWMHRLPLARAARDAGYEVIVASRFADHRQRIEDEGFESIPIRLRRRSRNPLAELLTIAELIQIYGRERLRIVYHVAVQPVIYGSWAARIARVPAVVNTFAGLGHVFVARDWRASILRGFIRLACKSALSMPNCRVIFENPDDRSLFVESGIVSSEKTRVILGTGVDITCFRPTPEPEGTPVILLASRMLWTKGVGEYVEASQYLKDKGLKCRVVLAGILDPDNAAAIPESTLQRWHSEGKIEWWGTRDDMPNVLAQANIVVLPTTYGEGVPRILMEAAAAGRAIVATDVPGCREIVRHGENGLLVPPGDLEALAEAMMKLLRDPVLRKRMGARGREIVTATFLEERVVRETLAVFRELLGERGKGLEI